MRARPSCACVTRRKPCGSTTRSCRPMRDVSSTCSSSTSRCPRPTGRRGARARRHHDEARERLRDGQDRIRRPHGAAERDRESHAHAARSRQARRGLDEVARLRREHEDRLRARGRDRERRCARARLRRRRRAVALEIRHATRCVRGRGRSDLGASQAALRRAALLRARRAQRRVRRRRRAARPAHSRRPARQHVGAGLGVAQ